MMMVPQAWEKYADLDPAVKAFYEYHQCVLEPWDGPAASRSPTACSAARRWTGTASAPAATRSGATAWWSSGSEVGPGGPRSARGGGVRQGRAGRGAGGRHQARARSSAISTPSARSPAGGPMPAGWRATWRRWCPIPRGCRRCTRARRCVRAQRSFGYGFEDLRLVLEPMGGTGADPVWSMGDDTPIPPLSAVPQSLYAYFRQRFAQVTNPPIDSLREAMVMSLRMHLGRRGSPLLERPSYARMLRLEHPVLLPEEMAALRNVRRLLDRHPRRGLGHDPRASDGLRPALTALRRAAERAARRGARILVHQRPRRRRDARARSRCCSPIGAVRQHLVHTGLRARVGLVAEAGDAFDIHHFATLIGYGAEAVHPWLALETLDGLFGEEREPTRRERDAEAAPRPRRRRRGAQFRSAAEKGLLKILSKMGISTLSLVLRRADLRGARPGPRGDQHLLRRHRVADRRASASRRSRRTCWRGTRGAIRDAARRRRCRCPTTAGCASGRKARTTAGRRRSSWRSQQAVKANGADAYGGFLAKNGGRRPAGPRDLLAVRRGHAGAARRGRAGRGDPHAASSPRRCRSGALSPEAHATLSIAMNRMGARSNSGEGGEDPHNYHGFANGDRADNRIKQVASRALRRDDRVPDARRGAGDQDRAGRQAGRGRPAARRTR